MSCNLPPINKDRVIQEQSIEIEKLKREILKLQSIIRVQKLANRICGKCGKMGHSARTCNVHVRFPL